MKYLLLFGFFLIRSTDVYSQSVLNSNFNENVNIANEIIVSLPEFKNLTDIEKLDTLYSIALKKIGNANETLLALTFASIPFKYFPLKSNLLGISFNIPLPIGDTTYFGEKIKSLPSKLFFDSPKSKMGDNDKIAHFFGNAFLTNSFHVFAISNIMGILVELFENTFKDNGSVDLRDLTINNYGAAFGILLNNYPDINPSSTTIFHNLIHFRM